MAGCEDSVVRLFDVSGRVALRTFKGHTKLVFHIDLFSFFVLNQDLYLYNIQYYLFSIKHHLIVKTVLNGDALSDPLTEFSDDLKNYDNL